MLALFDAIQGPVIQPDSQANASTNTGTSNLSGSRLSKAFSNAGIVQTSISWMFGFIPTFLIVSFIPPFIGYNVPS